MVVFLLTKHLEQIQWISLNINKFHPNDSYSLLISYTTKKRQLLTAENRFVLALTQIPETTRVAATFNRCCLEAHGAWWPVTKRCWAVLLVWCYPVARHSLYVRLRLLDLCDGEKFQESFRIFWRYGASRTGWNRRYRMFCFGVKGTAEAHWVFTVKNLPCRFVDLECCQCTLFRRKKIVKLRSSGQTKNDDVQLLAGPLVILVGLAPIFNVESSVGCFGIESPIKVCHFSVTFQGGNLRWNHSRILRRNGSGETNPFWQLGLFWGLGFSCLPEIGGYFSITLYKNVWNTELMFVFFLSVFQPSSIVMFILGFFEAKILIAKIPAKKTPRPSMSRWCRWRPLLWRKISAQIWAYLYCKQYPSMGLEYLPTFWLGFLWYKMSVNMRVPIGCCCRIVGFLFEIGL